jgi:hypothetical protein
MRNTTNSDLSDTGTMSLVIRPGALEQAIPTNPRQFELICD